MSVREILAKIDSLLPMPAVAAKLLEAAADPEASLSRVAAWLERDAGMTANVLRLCNSPIYGLRVQVNSVRQATNLLGTKKLVQIAVTLLASKHLAPPQSGYQLAAGDLWRSSLTSALAAELLAEEAAYRDPSAAYTAGLLQDVGKIALAEFVDGALLRIRELVEAEGLSWEEAERRAVGMPHTEAGSILLTRWKFPEILVESVRTHHNPSEATLDPALAHLSHVADALTMTLGVGLGADGLAYALDDASLESVGLTDRGRIEAVVERLAERVQRAESLFGAGRSPHHNPS
jgi:HD-like signal output (HDOD) protein